ncbi:MAG TPA: hypothetical protein VNE16_08205 [Vicinamibacterales bacterium]|nr:hypothetical protein [Vicinamibacterales bacterium]
MLAKVRGRRVCGYAILVALAGVGLAPAQAAPPAASSSAASAPADSFKHDTAPYSVGRVARMLAEAPPGDALHLNYNVVVVGQTPPPELFKDFNLDQGAVPFGAPTAQDFLNLTTPDAFKTPAIPFAPLLQWLVTRIKHH